MRKLRPPKSCRGGQTPPKIIDAANADAAAHNLPEQSRIAADGIPGKRIHRFRQAPLEQFIPHPDALPASVARIDSTSKSYQRLRLSFVPEGVLDGQRDYNRIRDPAGQMREARPQADRSHARIGELPLGGDPQGR